MLKPLDGNHGRGVDLDLRDRGGGARRVSPRAQGESRGGDVVVETYVPATTTACLVIGGQDGGDRRAGAGHVIGDGTHTVRELVDQRERRPAARHRPREGPHRIKVDDAAEALVRAQGYDLDDVPPNGHLASSWPLTGNMSTGGISIDRTLEAHPDNVEIAETAARVVGLDVAGIDFIAPDIAQPGARDGRRDRRGQRRAGLPDAHPSRPRASRSTWPSPCVDLLFPPGIARPHPDRGRDRHEREDDDRRG